MEGYSWEDALPVTGRRSGEPEPHDERTRVEHRSLHTIPDLHRRPGRPALRDRHWYHRGGFAVPRQDRQPDGGADVGDRCGGAGRRHVFLTRSRSAGRLVRAQADDDRQRADVRRKRRPHRDLAGFCTAVTGTVAAGCERRRDRRGRPAISCGVSGVQSIAARARRRFSSCSRLES